MKYDLVVLDEVQSVQGDSAGLKVYLEAGKFGRVNTEATAEAGFVMLGNITLDKNYEPVYQDEGIFNETPIFYKKLHL